MAARRWHIVLFCALLPFFAVNGWQALAGYNLPNSAAVAVFNAVVLVGLWRSTPA